MTYLFNKELCNYCMGTGAISGYKYDTDVSTEWEEETCPRCNGKGIFYPNRKTKVKAVKSIDEVIKDIEKSLGGSV